MADLRPVYVAGNGDVKGPASASNNFLPLFEGTTGKVLKSSGTGVTPQGLAILDDNTPAEQRNTIGLGQVNNTSDINKPVSAPQQKALDLKANKIDLNKVNNTSDIDKPVSAPQQKALDLKANKIDLDKVNNTSDINKPVSTAQQTALNLKQDKLLYTTVQQGGGIGQSTNKVYIGWSGTSKLKVTVDKTDLGNVAFNLDSVNNTSDINKPVSTLQQKALDLKANKIDLNKVNNTSDIDKPVSTLQQKALDLKANKVDLDKVDNTPDINKPVSTLQQKALDLKANKIDLDKVNNTSDINKPVSAPQQKALDLKANKIDLNNVNNTSDINKPVSAPQKVVLDSKLPLAGGKMTGTIALKVGAFVGPGNSNSAGITFDNSTGMFSPSKGVIQLVSNGAVLLSNSSGALDAGRGIRVPKGAPGATDASVTTGYTFNQDGDTGMFAEGGGVVGGSDLVFRIDSTVGGRIKAVMKAGSTSGWARLVGGKIFQWTQIQVKPTANGSTNWVAGLPTNFPSACHQAFAIQGSGNGPRKFQVTLEGFTKASCTGYVFSEDDGPRTLRIFAIGE